MHGRTRFVSVLMLAFSVSACTGTRPGASSEPAAAGGTFGQAAMCTASAGNTTFTDMRWTRVATAAQVLLVDRAGDRHVSVVAGMRGPIAPAVHDSTGAVPTTRSLLQALSRSVRVPVSRTTGPKTQPAKSWDGERLAPGRYIVFSGARTVTAQYQTACDSGVSRGVVTSWTTPTFGILDCRLFPAPNDSVAKTVADHCREASGKPA